MIVAGPRIYCVCLFRACFLLEACAATFELVVVLSVTLPFAAVEIIPVTNQGTKNYFRQDTFHFLVIPIPRNRDGMK